MCTRGARRLLTLTATVYPMDSFVYVARQKIETRHRQRSYLTALKTALEDACKWARISGCKKAFRATVGLNKAKNEPAIILKFRPTDARGKGGEAKRRMSKRTKMWVANRILRIMARCYGERAQPALAMSFPPRLWFMDQKKTLFLYTDDYPWRDKEFNEWQNRLIVDEIRGEMGSATEGRTP
ncbi:hypothetical protein F4802DRAFT_199909 [Xylaria palmicola]|nr:hypothetical protein F4802DRAFT_199909 [Xylaria palmicola]